MMFALATRRHCARDLVLLAVLGVLATTGCRHGTSEKKVLVGTATGGFQPRGELESLLVVNSSGSVRIESSSGAAIEVDAGVKVVASRAAEFGGELALDDHVSIRQEGAELTVENAHRGAPDQGDWQLELTVRLPQEARLQVRLGAGHVGMNLPAAKGIDVDVGAGEIDIDVETIDGGVSCRVGAGDLSLSVAKSAPTEDVDLECAAGKISLSLPPQFSGDFDVTAAVGDVSVAERYGLQVDRKLTAASASGPVGEGGPRYKLRAATGAIELK